MEEEDIKYLTTKMGECYHEGMKIIPCSVGSLRTPCIKCGKQGYNRTFDNWVDFGAVWMWIKDQDWWYEFMCTYQPYGHEVILNIGDYIDHTTLPKLVVKFLISRESEIYDRI